MGSSQAWHCEKGLVQLIESRYENARSIVCEKFSVKVGVHQGFCVSPLMIITVLKALSQECVTGPWENLYADDLVIITESLEELQEKLILWKTNMEKMDFGSTWTKPRS